jgi:hypothetical protein
LDKLILNHTVKKESEGGYYTIGFDVPENVERVTVSYNYRRLNKKAFCREGFKNIIDIGLVDCDGRYLGWSGSARASIFVGEYGSTKGYVTQKIKAGRWQIIVGAYKISGGGVDVEYTVEFKEKMPRLLFGDLHVHSDASDGELDIPSLAELAVKKGLDFIGVADHNNFSENFSFPRVAGLTFIPVVEWTHYKGHMNFFGVKNPFENTFIANSADEMKALIKHAKSLGAVISVNHPKCGMCPYVWDDEESFDMIEVWNGPMRPANVRSADWWTELLKKGRKIPIVGGSDFHKRLLPLKFANPVTAVFAGAPDAESILSAVSRGQSFVTSSVKGPVLNLRYKDTVLGGTARLEHGVPLEIEASRLGGADLVLVTAYGEKKLCTGKNEAKINEHMTETEFAYIKAVKRVFGVEFIKAISNPVYFS